MNDSYYQQKISELEAQLDVANTRVIAAKAGLQSAKEIVAQIQTAHVHELSQKELMGLKFRMEQQAKKVLSVVEATMKILNKRKLG